MNPIFAALAQGYESDEILNFMTKMMPQIAPRIRRAKYSGHSSRKILEYLSKSMDEESSEELQASNKISARQKKRHADITKGLVKEGLKIGTYAFGAGLLARAAPHVLSRFPQIGKFLGPKALSEAIKPEPTTPIEVEGEKPELEKASPDKSQEESFNLLESKGIGKIFRQLSGQVENSGQMFLALQKLYGKDFIKNLEIQHKRPASEIIQGAYEFVRTHQETPVESIQKPEPEKPVEEGLKSEKPTIGSNILLPDGEIGVIEKLPGETAKLDIDGKKKVLKSRDLQLSPITKSELAELYNDLLKGIESHTGQEVSRNVNLAGYDAENNELVYTPHSGTTYVYRDIPQEDVDELLSFMNRKTTGENYIGAWEAGTESPIGAAISKLIQKLVQERGKGKEYSRKYNSIYDAIKPAREAAQELYRMKKKHGKRQKQT